MLRELSARHRSWPLAAPFRISRGVKHSAEAVVVEIHEGGCRGRAESVPYARYGETIESVLQQIESVRPAITGDSRSGYFREYPFAWFGILCEAPPSAEELIYSNSQQGFALISQRSPEVQRMYFQCDPDADPNAMSEAELWDTLQARVPGKELKRGEIFQRDILRFRSFVASDLRRGRVVLVGDAAHTVPPTGAKGMNLAVADVVLLADALRAALAGDARLIEAFPETASHRIWKAQHFSWWMTSMLHLQPGASDFDRQRQLGELRTVVESEAGRTYLAEAYTGWPLAGVERVLG